MQHVVDPELLAGLLRSLAGEALPRFGDGKDREKIGELIAVDGTLLPALPRMAWAIWQNPQNRAGKLHLEFNVWRQIPVEFTVTNGNGNERAVWKSKLKAGACYVNDRGYSHDYRVIKEVQKAGAHHVLRLYNNSLITRLEEPRTLTQADREAGVFEDVKVRLGNDEDGPQGRLVRVEKDGHTFLLFTNLEDIEAELVSLIYRCRWQIELFFKWIKCVLGCRHWLAESQAGVTIQVYCALIASVLLVLWTGSRPTKRQWETLQLYWMGWVTLEELQARLLPRKKSAAARSAIFCLAGRDGLRLPSSKQSPLPLLLGSRFPRPHSPRRLLFYTKHFSCRTLLARRFLTAFSGDSNSDQISPSCVAKH